MSPIPTIVEPLHPRWKQGQVVGKPTASGDLILEAWAMGYLVGSLIIMVFITLANMRRGVLLHKLILAELILGIWQGFYLFFHSPVHAWWLSVSAIFLNASWSLHNVIAWVKLKPFLSKPVSFIFIGTVVLVQAYWVLEIYANFAYFHGVNELFTRTRPWEALFRDPWWISTTVYLFWVIQTQYELTVREIVRISPRFGIMLLAMMMSIIFAVLDICTVTGALRFLGLATGINPFWKLAFVFKCLTDSVILEDFKGWENLQGDNHFRVQRYRADNADEFGKRIFYNMMCQIGDELHEMTSALLSTSSLTRNPANLDLCMAPGGFTASVLKRNCDARVCGINSRIQVRFLDITMLAAEMDVTDIPVEHSDARNFMFDLPFYGEAFDLVFCDGQVLRTHSRAEYREKREAWRLMTSQLVFALQRVKENSKIVVLLHKLDAWDTVYLLYTLRKFSSLQLFKPRRKHAIRSSFYFVAEQIEPESPWLQVSVTAWKKEWYIATFGCDTEYRDNRSKFQGTVDEVLSDFGTELLELGQSIWEVQSAALRESSFLT
ncbi:uncharacterized protein ALTATR162_LOCUS160 [Alternaria atra]|uniref:Ribosomal RNA methyltransferase FtsJ domain-containing protein n=1 Tax=Alternaria atra TaxID=119953 RepID=A0A8J2HRG7_9PLEO|nr:uncharacterized protein ALTATR162_LOCUS160 [Alternaria atra]CAG5137587.1 unnamed protein product [Alternaria atra]